MEEQQPARKHRSETRQTRQGFLLVKGLVMCDSLSPISHLLSSTKPLRFPITRQKVVQCDQYSNL